MENLDGLDVVSREGLGRGLRAYCHPCSIMKRWSDFTARGRPALRATQPPSSMATPGRWWIAGGWAIDAYTNTDRAHADLDIGIPPARTPRPSPSSPPPRWMCGRQRGSLTPLPPWDGVPSIPADCGNLWLRASGGRSVGVRRSARRRPGPYLVLQARRRHLTTPPR